MKRSEFGSVLLLLVASCMMSADKAEAPAQAMDDAEAEMALGSRAGGAGGLPPSAPARLAAKKEKAAFASNTAALGDAFEEIAIEGKGSGMFEVDGAAPAEDAAAPATRAWFPETFLFEPLVETDANGRASLDVKIPDRLTTWRILALAHSRDGAQAGDVATVLGTLPVYLDPLVPKVLLAGDVVDLPIQIVNNTEGPVSGSVAVKAVGAVLLSAVGDVSLPAGGSTVRYARLRTERPGEVTLSARFGSYDAVERTFEVRPRGRPVPIERGGTLAAPRELSITVPSDADPNTAKVRLVVFPGALSVLTNEVQSAPARGGAAADAYALLLSGRASALATSLGGEVDEQVLRRMRIVATQRALAHTRSADDMTAALFAEAALAHPDQPLLSRLGERLAAQVANAQRPDGTFFGGAGWTLQRLLVATADGVHAVRAGDHEGASPAASRRAKSVTLRASGAFERHLRSVDDPYTAAAVLASGAVSGTIRDELRARVKDALVEREDGARVLPVPKQVVRRDGQRPTEIEATALAVLALAEDESARALLPDLGAALLATYRPWSGFGDPATNLVALRAVLEVFREPIPDRVQIRLSRDGQEVLRGAIDPKRKHERYALAKNVDDPLGTHTWTVEADPPVPGLGFTFVMSSYVPWPVTERRDVALEIDVAREARVGNKTDVQVRVAAPTGTRVTVEHRLPAGVDPDTASLAEQQRVGRLEAYAVDEGVVRLTFAVPAGDAPIAYAVIPSFAGSLHAPASSVEILGRGITMHVPPSVWSIAR